MLKKLYIGASSVLLSITSVFNCVLADALVTLNELFRKFMMFLINSERAVMNYRSNSPLGIPIY